MIVAPIYGRIDQGLIFTGATADNYLGCEVSGIIITARCDLAHGKAPVYNYLPTVHFNDWLQRDYIALLTEKIHGEIIGKIKVLLLNAGHSSSILERQSPRSILEKLFPPTATETPALKSTKYNDQRTQLETLVGNYEKFAALDKSNVRELHAAYAKSGQQIIKSCIKQSLNGYYFLPRIAPGTPDLGYVVLLREVRFMPVKLGDMIVGGLDSAAYAELTRQDPRMSGCLQLTEDFAGPVGRLIPPYIEHLLQQFSALFGRIGLKDIEEDYITNLYSRQPCATK